MFSSVNRSSWYPEEALGQRVELIIPDHLRAAHWSGFDAAMTKGATKLQGRPTLTRALHKNGHRLYVEMSFAIVKGNTKNEALGAVAVARDLGTRFFLEILFFGFSLVLHNKIAS
jgi:hypothetical protein